MTQLVEKTYSETYVARHTHTHTHTHTPTTTTTRKGDASLYKNVPVVGWPYGL